LNILKRTCPHCGGKTVSGARVALSDLFGGSAMCSACGKRSGHGALARSVFALSCAGIAFSFAASSVPDRYVQLYGFLPVLGISVILAAVSFFSGLAVKK